MKKEILVAMQSLLVADESLSSDQRELTLAVLTSDPVASRERIETAAKVMSGKLALRDIMPICKRKEAASLLGINIRTIDYYVRKGILPGIRGCGNRIIGIARENIIEYMLHHGLDPKDAYR